MRANHKKGCYICDSYRNLEVHHIIPRWRGGNLLRNNTVLLCKRCHADIERGNENNILKVAARCAERAVKNLRNRAYKQS